MSRRAPRPSEELVLDLLALMPGTVERIRRVCGPADESGLPAAELERHVEAVARDAIGATVAPRHQAFALPQFEEFEPAAAEPRREFRHEG